MPELELKFALLQPLPLPPHLHPSPSPPIPLWTCVVGCVKTLGLTFFVINCSDDEMLSLICSSAIFVDLVIAVLVFRHK